MWVTIVRYLQYHNRGICEVNFMWPRRFGISRLLLYASGVCLGKRGDDAPILDHCDLPWPKWCLSHFLLTLFLHSWIPNQSKNVAGFVLQLFHLLKHRCKCLKRSFFLRPGEHIYQSWMKFLYLGFSPPSFSNLASLHRQRRLISDRFPFPSAYITDMHQSYLLYLSLIVRIHGAAWKSIPGVSSTFLLTSSFLNFGNDGSWIR